MLIIPSEITGEPQESKNKSKALSCATGDEHCDVHS